MSEVFGVWNYDETLPSREDLELKFEGLLFGVNPEKIKDFFHQEKEKCFAKLDGEFCFSLFDSKNKTLYLVRDSIGVRPLYYYKDARRIAFASQIKDLLDLPGVQTLPNDLAVAEYLTKYDNSTLGQTCFKNIFSVRPSHYLKISPPSFQEIQYWDFDIQKCIRFTEKQEYVDEFALVFQNAVKRRVQSLDSVSVSVSGGLDSSSIFCVAQKLYEEGQVSHPPQGFTLISNSKCRANEENYITAIESKYGVNLHRTVMEEHFDFSHIIGDMIYACEAPLIEYQWGAIRTQAKRASQLGIKIMLSGLWGDEVLFPSEYLIDLLRAGSFKKVLDYSSKFQNWYEGDDLRYIRKHALRSFATGFVPKQLKRMFRKPEPWDKMDFPHLHAREIYSNVRRKATSSTLEWLQKSYSYFGVNISFPMLDRTLLQFIMSIPGEILNLDGVPRGLLRAAGKNILPPLIAERKNKGDADPLLYSMAFRHSEEMVKTLRESSVERLRKYIKTDRLNKALARSDVEELVCSYGLELWFQKFIDNRKTSP